MRYKGDEKVTFTRPFLMLGKDTFDEHVNYKHLQNVNGSLSKIKGH